MSLEIERTRPRARRAYTFPARPSAPAPHAPPLESFRPPPPRCRWPEGCTREADIWHQLRFCKEHAQEERIAWETRERLYKDPLDRALAECLAKLDRNERRLRALRIAQDALSHRDVCPGTPGGNS